MHPAIIIGTVRSLIVDVAMGQIPRSTERISSLIKDGQMSEIISFKSRFFDQKTSHINCS